MNGVEIGMIYDQILVRFGDLTLKGKNQKDFYNRLLLILGNNVVYDSSLIMKNSTINSYGYGLVVGQPSSNGENELIIGPSFGDDYEELPHSIEITNTKITGNGGLIIGDNYAESIVVENCEIVFIMDFCIYFDFLKCIKILHILWLNCLAPSPLWFIPTAKVSFASC